MRVFIIQELGWVYNDEYYSCKDGGSPVQAFRSQKRAKEVCEEMNRRLSIENANEEYPMQDSDGRKVDEFYEVVETEMDDDSVEPVEPTDYAAHQALAADETKKAVALLKDDLLGRVGEVFNKFPKLESFGWRQYTVSFNDGDPCPFYVLLDEPYINGERFEGTYDDDWNLIQSDWRNAAADAMAGLVNSYQDDHLQTVFGDPAHVIINRDLSVEVEYGFSHD